MEVIALVYRMARSAAWLIDGQDQIRLPLQ